MIIDILKEALLDTLKTVPFLFLAYAHGGVHTIEDVLRNCLGDSKIPGNA